MTRRLSTAADAEPVLRLSAPSDILHAIPYLLGFHPVESLVLLGLTEPVEPGRRPHVCIVARLDLDDVATCPPAVTSAVTGAVRAGARVVFGAVFAASLAEAIPWAAPLVEVERMLSVQRLPVTSWLFTGSDGWMTGRLSEQGVELVGPFPHESGSRVAAEATYAGLVARADRTELAGLLTPEPPDQRAGLHASLAELARERAAEAPARRSSRRRGDIRALFRASRSLPLLESGQVVRFGIALTDIEVRDACWLAIEASRIDGDGLWRELSRRLPDGYRPAALFLFGWCQWRSGNGALAAIAAEAALECDPDYNAAQLLVGALQHGLDPRSTPRLRKGA